ncbi:MAG: putative DNA binding domain-containing protein [Clostridiales bacterium]|nr:putative DNA binding domain-containing protein [Clostridiales bacterium]
MATIDRKLNDELLLTLQGLIANWENEVIEFKQADNDYDKDRIGRYFSALSNEANLRGLQHGWLVFGVDNKTHAIVGSSYRDTKGLDTLKHEIGQNTTGGIAFTDIFEVYDGEKRIVMFKIPAAVVAVPTAWKNHWYGREGESLGALSMEELDRLRGQVRRDWSKRVIDGSGLNHLDAEAIRIARESYKAKQNREHISAEVDKMTDEQFLTRLKLVVGGKLTNAAMVLLGNPDHDSLLDTPARAMWRLYGSNDIVKDYKEFGIPFISVVDKVYAKVRNLTYRYIPNRRSLQTIDIPQYDVSLQRELLFNSIAHMDYTQGGRIYVDEYEDYIIVQNPGSFLPGDVLTVLQPWYTAPYYRNQLLAESMASFNMIDTVAMGIRKVFRIQQERLFPLPDYFFMKPEKVVVRVYGKTLDENYMRMLYDHPEFNIETVYLLDCVQKKQPLNPEQYNALRKLHLIEGKSPNVFVSAAVAAIIDEKAQYIKNRGQSDQYYKQMIIDYLHQWGQGTRQDFLTLLGDKFSDVLDEKQKVNKVKYFLATLRKEGIITQSDGNQRTSQWVLAE